MEVKAATNTVSEVKGYRHRLHESHKRPTRVLVSNLVGMVTLWWIGSSIGICLLMLFPICWILEREGRQIRSQREEEQNGVSSACDPTKDPFWICQQA
jgi:hypothetical protein